MRLMSSAVEMMPPVGALLPSQACRRLPGTRTSTVAGRKPVALGLLDAGLGVMHVQRLKDMRLQVGVKMVPRPPSPRPALGPDEQVPGGLGGGVPDVRRVAGVMPQAYSVATGPAPAHRSPCRAADSGELTRPQRVAEDPPSQLARMASRSH